MLKIMSKVAVVLALLVWVGGCLNIESETHTTNPPTEKADRAGRSADGELARLLVKMERRTRAVVAGHYKGADAAHREWMSRNLILPASVADRIFSETVPAATGGRAWVKMVVDAPRNENNRGDRTALSMLDELRSNGKASTQRSTSQAFYYAEPIKTKPACLLCHGEPRGGPDPFFPKYKKNGWKVNQIIGAVVARVAPAD
jgi:hypothetical protein